MIKHYDEPRWLSAVLYHFIVLFVSVVYMQIQPNPEEIHNVMPLKAQHFWGPEYLTSCIAYMRTTLQHSDSADIVLV